MNEDARQFNQALEDENFDGSDGLMNLAQQLKTADFSDDSRIRESLHQQLTTQNQRASKSQYRRLLMQVAAMMLLISLVTVTVPPLRTLAQDVLARIGLVSVTNAPTFAEQLLETGWPPEFDDEDWGESLYSDATWQEIADFTGFEALYVPTSIEDWGYIRYKSARRHADLEQLHVVIRDIRHTTIDNIQDDNTISYHQTRYNSVVDFAIGDAGVVPVTVRGVDGLWVESSNLILDRHRGEFSLVGVSVLMWKEDGYLFRISGKLTLGEMQQFADSLTPITP